MSTTPGDFASENYPNSYGYSKVCTWKLVTDNNFAVQLECKKFDVECYDKFVVYNGKNVNAILSIRQWISCCCCCFLLLFFFVFVCFLHSVFLNNDVYEPKMPISASPLVETYSEIYQV